MRLLLDTHAFLWWYTDDPELHEGARQALLDERNPVFVSAAVGWEIVIKRALGRLEFDGDVASAVADEGFQSLPVTVEHTDEVGRLPGHHRDPFDRLLVAQARTDDLVLVTRDAHISRYEGFRRLDA